MGREQKPHQQADHGIGFETAQMVFSDPLMVQKRDPNSEDERWHTMGMVSNVVVMVAHTWPGSGQETGVEVGRIVSVRKATAHAKESL